MSKESANVFLEKLVRDPRLRAEVFGSGSAGVELAAERLTEVGAREGYAFSPEEIVQAHAQRVGSASRELAEGELDAVAGGSATGGAGAGKIKFNEFTIKQTLSVSSSG